MSRSWRDQHCATYAGRLSAAAILRLGYTVRRRNRFWEIVDSRGQLICMTVYKRGAIEVIRRFAELASAADVAAAHRADADG